MNFGNVLILGDSYSTFRGHIPAGFAPYYLEDADYTDVHDVRDTWWHSLIAKTGSVLVQNNSWSGSTVCHTGYEGRDCSETSSFLFRVAQLERQGFFRDNRIDTVFVFGGTNDSWADSPLGERMSGGWQKADLYAVLPAMDCLLARLKTLLPESRIVCIVNTELKPEITGGYLDSCREWGVAPVMLQDIDKTNGHPTVKGMAQIRDQILAAFEPEKA